MLSTPLAQVAGTSVTVCNLLNPCATTHRARVEVLSLLNGSRNHKYETQTGSDGEVVKNSVAETRIKKRREENIKKKRPVDLL